MTTSMPLMPAATRAPGSAGATSSRPSTDGGSPAFANALDDALTDRAPSRPADRATDRADDRAAEHADRAAGRRPGSATDDDPTDPTSPVEDAAQGAGTPTAPPPVVLPPGLWALLAAAAPPTPETSIAPTTAAIGTGPDTATTASPVAPALPQLATPAAPPTTAAVDGAVAAPAAAEVPGPVPGGPLPAGPLPAGPLPAAMQVLAAAAGLTVVVDPLSAGTATTSTATTSTATTSTATTSTATTRTAAPSTAATSTATATRAADRPAAAVTDVPVLFPSAGSTDTPDTGSDGSAGDSALTAASTTDAAPAAVDTDTVFTLSGPAPVTPAAPVAPTTAPAAPAAPVAAQLGRQIAVLRNAPDGSQTMTVVITPENLGPVTVAVTVTDGKLDLTLHGAHEAGRHALREALPELRRELESAGLTFDRLELDTTSRDSGASLRNSQQQLLDSRAGQQGGSGQPGQQDSRPRAWGSSPDRLGAGPATVTTDQSASAGVDVRV